MKFLRWVPLALFSLGSVLWAAAPPGRQAPLPAEFKDYRTVSQVIRARISQAAPAVVSTQPGYLGVTLEEKEGRFVVRELAVGSPARSAGLKVGDVVLQVEGQPLRNQEMLAELVRARGAGGKLNLAIEREGKSMEQTLTLAPVSRPLTPGKRVVLGVQIEEVPEGIRLKGITAKSPADQAQLKVGDILLAINGEKLAGKQLSDELASKQGGEQVRLTVQRGDRTFEVTTTLVMEDVPERGGRRGGRSWDDRSPRLFRRPVYRLAVVPIEYPDVKHNPKIKTTDWEESLFSTGTYMDRSVTGQRVYGSMNDYYREISVGQFSVEGKCFDWVMAKRKRAEYANDSNRYALLTEALDKLLERDGKTALDGFDGIYFLYAGERFQTRRGGLYWPHRASLNHRGKRWSYFICPEGGKTIASISVITHEFGHMLGLPDLYARPEVPGEEGLGVWCTMSTGHGRDGKPLHFSAWCKEQLGWLKPVEIDPRVKQKIVLAPVNGSTTECIKIPVRADGSEYLLLENRRKIGYDRDLPAEGLLIWRVVNGKPVLEESHGVTGPEGPRTFLGSIPYPSSSNHSFTPFTTPSSKSLKGGGFPVHITNIQKLPDGRIAFQIGYEYL